MNLDHRVQLRRFNASRKPFGPHSIRRVRVNWWGLVLPIALLFGATLMLPLALMVITWFQTP